MQEKTNTELVRALVRESNPVQREILSERIDRVLASKESKKEKV